MSLATPGKIIAFRDKLGVRMAQVDFVRVTRETCMHFVLDASLGDYPPVAAIALRRAETDGEEIQT
jgi:hydrogenase maturation factor